MENLKTLRSPQTFKVSSDFVFRNVKRLGGA